MGEHDIKPTCLSAQLHNPEDIRDIVLHYFGCIEISERKDFFNKDKDIWKYEEEIELEKIQLFQPEFRSDDKRKREARSRVEKKIGSLAVAVEAQYKRIDILRHAIETDALRTSPAESNSKSPTKSPPPADLVKCVANSHREWKDSDSFKAGIEKVRNWRRKIGKPVDDGNAVQEQTKSSTKADIPEEREVVRKIVIQHQKLKEGWFEHPDHAVGDYSLERDVNAYVVQFKRTSPEEDEDFEPPSQEDSGLSKRPQLTRESSSASTKTGSPLTYLKPEDEPQDDLRFKGQFPDQRVAMQYLLEKDDDKPILWRGRNPDRLRYFHIPCNNMEWVEEAIARYFDEDRPDYNGLFRNPSIKKRSRTYMVLRPEYWRGQQHGGRAAVVHARHLRPLCETVSSDKHEVEQNPKNVVLFMPYLHWETDRNREKMAQVIDTETEKHRTETHMKSTAEKRKRIDERGAPTSTSRRITHKSANETEQSQKRKHHGPLRTMTEVINAIVRKGHHPQDSRGLRFDENGRMLVPHSPLGQFLIDAARLYEAIANYRDKKLLETFLHKDPPLHPRRTLDQSYYWTLKTTKARDRDQVVYRGTTLNTELAHRLEELKPKEHESKFDHFKSKLGQLCSKPNPEASDSTTWRWTDHTTHEDEHGCDQCKSDIRKVSRLIMVDQLWMWILDEKTIITCFPRRYGTNKQDPSGVHKSIRNRLRAARKNQIRSVFDLALIILDECSNTFFDRTKTQDRHPQVMDLFAEAIGNVTNHQTISFQHLWHWTEKACTIYRAKTEHIESNDLHVPLLDINPEGKLQREIKDIVDELDIMIHINRKQKEVLKRFSKHVEHILDPEGHWRERSSNHDWDEGLRPPMPIMSKKLDDHNGEHEKREQFDWFRIQAFELLSEVTDRIDELEGLKKSAESTAQSVNDLLALKQQQASVVQAWQSVKQAKETVKQGRAIMMFTIVTIVFLPLSFMSSVFGMNNSNFSGDNWTLHQQFQLMFPISAGIIIAAVVLAFSNFLRALIWSAYMYISTIFIIHTGIYRLWLTGREEWNSQALMRHTEEKVRKMKEEVRKQKRQRARWRAMNAEQEHEGNSVKKPWKKWRKKKKQKQAARTQHSEAGDTHEERYELSTKTASAAGGSERGAETVRHETGRTRSMPTMSGANGEASQRVNIELQTAQPSANRDRRGRWRRNRPGATHNSDAQDAGAMA